MIFLGKEEVEKLVDPNEIMDQIEEAYRIFGADAYYMPPRPVIEHENKTLIYMPCFTEDIIGTKMLTIFPENAKLGLPSLDGLVILNDRTTGAPLAIMDGQAVTEDRGCRRCGDPPSVQKGCPHSRYCRRWSTGLPPGCVRLRGQEH